MLGDLFVYSAGNIQQRKRNKCSLSVGVLQCNLCSQDWQLRGVLHHGGHLHPGLRLARHRPGLHLQGQGGGVGGRPHLPLLPHPGLRRVRRRQGLPGRPVLSGRYFSIQKYF